MNIITVLYTMLTAVSRWIEGLRIALLVRVWGISNKEKPPIPWREREKLPPHDQWPMEKSGKDFQFKHSAFLVRGAVKVGPVKPVPAALDKEPTRG